MKQYEPKTDDSFQRWMNKYYPEENHIKDRYNELYREWWPRKYAVFSLGMLAIILCGTIMVASLWPTGDLLWGLLSIIFWVPVFLFACFVLVYGPLWANQRSAKPTPKRKKKE